MSKILICDYESTLESNYEPTLKALKTSLKENFDNYEIVIKAYENDEQLISDLDGVDGLITAFLEIGEGIFSKANDLKCISISGAGYSNVDCNAANKYNIKVCHIEEYCTQEVAEHTFALINALNRNLAYYRREIASEHKWMYHTIAGGQTLSNQTIAIWGYGKIGKRVARIAQGYNMNILAVDPYADINEAKLAGVTIVSEEEALQKADIITNHMNLTDNNKHFFNKTTFSHMSKRPIFINVGRGGCVNETDLIDALDKGIIRAAGLDVLEAENPDLANCKLLDRDNVIITPHSAFYSDDSIRALQEISGKNLGYFLSGNYDKIYSVVKECR